MNCESFLEPYNGVLSTTRNGSELTELCEKLVITFIRNGASNARVRKEEIGYGFSDLYSGLYNICRRKAFKELVLVHRQNGDVFLIRKRPILTR